MSIDKMTRELKEIQSALGKTNSSNDNDSHWAVGKTYFIRTVTHHYTGVLVKVTPKELVLKDAAWIADDGRFSDSLRTGNFSEIEPFQDGEVIIGRGALLDASIYNFASPRKQK